MSLRICLCANTLGYAQGGHLWVYLNWALGLRALGCDVLWMEEVPACWSQNELRMHVEILRKHLNAFGLSDHVVLCPEEPGSVLYLPETEFFSLDKAVDADLLLNFRYGLPPDVVGRFRCAAL